MGSRLDGSMIFQFSGIRKLDKNYFKTHPKVAIFLNRDLELTFEWILTRLGPEKTSQNRQIVQNFQHWGLKIRCQSGASKKTKNSDVHYRFTHRSPSLTSMEGFSPTDKGGTVLLPLPILIGTSWYSTKMFFSTLLGLTLTLREIV